MSNLNVYVMSGVLSAVVAMFGAVDAAHAATTTATVPVTLAVNNPKCTVANGAASFNLPSVSTPSTTTAGAYVSANFGIAGASGGDWKTDSSLNQVATITCDTNNTVISNFVVQPGAGATVASGQAAIQYPVDKTTPTPVKLAGGSIALTFEQVSINGNATAYSYSSSSNGSITPYTVPFTASTPSGTNYTATVVWRPELSSAWGPATNPIGNPTGGNYIGSAQIIANY